LNNMDSQRWIIFFEIFVCDNLNKECHIKANSHCNVGCIILW